MTVHALFFFIEMLYFAAGSIWLMALGSSGLCEVPHFPSTGSEETKEPRRKPHRHQENIYINLTDSNQTTRLNYGPQTREVSMLFAAPPHYSLVNNCNVLTFSPSILLLAPKKTHIDLLIPVLFYCNVADVLHAVVNCRHKG